ncbi:hypothetical protein [Luteimonas sp. A649]
MCAAALPAFEGLVRKRPLAIQNEGSSTAFVSCAPPQFGGHASNPQLGLDIFVANMGASAATVTCTGVTWINGEQIYLVKSTTMAAGQESQIWWDNSGTQPTGDFIYLSCSLPPGTGIGKIITYGASVTLRPEM